MGEIVSYEPYKGKFFFNENSLWAETILAVMNANNVKQTAKIIFSNIILNVKQQPLKFPSQQELAKAADVSDRTVRRHIRELKDIGLLEVPEKCGRINRYIIRDYRDTHLTYSVQAEKYLKNLLNVKVEPFSVTQDKNVLVSDDLDKNVLVLQEKEEKEKEEKKESTKERKEDKEKEERELALKSAESSSDSLSHLSLAERRRIQLSSEKKSSPKEIFDKPKKKTSLFKGTIPEDPNKWKVKDIERFFFRTFKKHFGEVELKLNFAKNRAVIKNFIQSENPDKLQLKEVIEFVIENWEDIKTKLKINSPLPTIGLVFSRFYETFFNINKQGFSSHSLKNVRSDFEFDSESLRANVFNPDDYEEDE